MHSVALRQVRLERGWTQQEAARRLGLSQSYLSMLETGGRPTPGKLLGRLTRLFKLPPTALPFSSSARYSQQALAKTLGALGYPGYLHLAGTRRNPAEFLLHALSCHDLDSRLARALPWVVLRYPDMNWDVLLPHAKAADLQNRLGFVVSLAFQLALRDKGTQHAQRLRNVRAQLSHSRLAREDTLCRESMSTAERDWLRNDRERTGFRRANYWRLLTDMTPDYVEAACA